MNSHCVSGNTHCVVHFEDECVSCVPCKSIVTGGDIFNIGDEVEVQWTDGESYKATILELGDYAAAKSLEHQWVKRLEQESMSEPANKSAEEETAKDLVEEAAKEPAQETTKQPAKKQAKKPARKPAKKPSTEFGSSLEPSAPKKMKMSKKDKQNANEEFELGSPAKAPSQPSNREATPRETFCDTQEDFEFGSPAKSPSQPSSRETTPRSALCHTQCCHKEALEEIADNVLITKKQIAMLMSHVLDIKQRCTNLETAAMWQPTRFDDGIDVHDGLDYNSDSSMSPATEEPFSTPAATSKKPSAACTPASTSMELSEPPASKTPSQRIPAPETPSQWTPASEARSQPTVEPLSTDSPSSGSLHTAENFSGTD